MNLDNITPADSTEPVASPVKRTRKPRDGKGAAFMRQLASDPGTWITYRSYDREDGQHKAHAYASWLRRTHPAAQWEARRDTTGMYEVRGRIAP